jgi:exopolysaccharide production protein ExoQ
MTVVPGRPAAGSRRVDAELWASLLVVLMLAPAPWLFAGVDQTITGVVAAKSFYLIFKTTLVALWLPWLWSEGRVLDGRSTAASAVPLATLAGVALLSVSWSSNPYVTARGAFELSLGLLFAAALVGRFGPDRIPAVLAKAGAIFVTLALVVVVMAPQHSIHGVGDALHASHHGRWRGLYEHKNLFGHVCACFSLVAAYLVLYVPKRRLAGTILLALCIVCLTFAESSTAWFMVIVGVATFGTLAFEGRSRVLGLAATTVLFSLVALAGADLEAVAGLFGRDGTLTGRLTLWEHTIASVGDRWLFGSGYANIAFLSEYLSGVVLFTARDAHNGFLELWATLGLTGILIALVVIGFALRDILLRASPRRPASVLFSALVMAWLAASMTEVSPLRPGTALFQLSVIALLALATSHCLPRVRSMA